MVCSVCFEETIVLMVSDLIWASYFFRPREIWSLHKNAIFCMIYHGFLKVDSRLRDEIVAI